MAMLMIMRYGKYTNTDAVENVVRYITRTRRTEDRADELVAWGGLGIGCYQTPELAIEQFRRLQNLHNIAVRKGPRVFHEVLGITEEEFGKLGYDYGSIYQIAMKCAQYYYDMRHQVIFAIHHAKGNGQVGNKGLHIHFVVNTINFVTENKWHTNMGENFKRQQSFNEILREFMPASEWTDEWPEV